MMSGVCLEERDLLRIFQNRISDIHLDNENSHAEHLLRWIRAREGDISKAEEMLRRHVEWRKRNEIGPSLLTWKPPSFIADNYGAKFCGYDNSGSPILLFTFGVWDIRPALACKEKANLIRYKDQCLEKVMQLMKLYELQRKHHSSLLSTCPEKVTQFNCICDWSGFSIRYIMSKEAVEVLLEAARSFEANYPETLKAAFNVNCPKVFDVLFKLVKPFLSDHTLSKIFIYDSNEAKWKRDILKRLPLDQVPVRYGGIQEKLWNFTDLNLDLSQDGHFFSEIFSEALSSHQAHENPYHTSEREGYKTLQIPFKDKISIPILIASPRTMLKWQVKAAQPEDVFDLEIQCENENYTEREVCMERTQITNDSGCLQCELRGNYWVVFSNTSGRVRDRSLTVLYKLAFDVVGACEVKV